MTEHHLKCKCGAFEATFNQPPRLIFNCQCHSCVAAIAGIEAKESFSGTSMKCDTSENSGAAVAVYKSNNVTVTKVDDAKIGFMKVGDKGKVARPYCKDCGTVLFNVWLPNWCAANRNAMTTSDGTALPSDSVMNVNCSKSFDKTKCPKPSHGSVPFGMLFKFIPLLAGIGCDGSNGKEKALIPEDISKVESVPITWE